MQTSKVTDAIFAELQTSKESVLACKSEIEILKHQHTDLGREVVALHEVKSHYFL